MAYCLLALLLLAQPLGPDRSMGLSAETWIDAGNFGALHVVIPEDPSPLEQRAVETFQKYWQACTYSAIDASPSNAGRINVWLGRDALNADLVSHRDIKALGGDQFLVRAFVPGARLRSLGAEKQLVIAANSDHATLNGVYEFFRQALNVRWFAPDFTRTPSPGIGIDRFNVTYGPVFKFREIGYHALWPEAEEYRHAHGLHRPVAHGPFGAHTFYHLLPPDKYFADHPEYYAEVNGERTAPTGNWRTVTRENAAARGAAQLCCTNPATAEAVLREAIALIEAGPDPENPAVAARRRDVMAHPDRKVVSVSQMDWGGACTCDSCREADGRAESPMGSVLVLVNRVAEGLEEAFPGKGYKAHTLAYRHTRPAPEDVRLRDNVIVQLSSVECDFSRPLDDPESGVNRAFMRDLQGWSALTDDLYIWNYAANLGHPLRAHPNLHVVQHNLQLLTQYYVTGVYEQGWAESGAELAEFAPLRSYVLSRCTWDPDLPGSIPKNEFNRRYYGKAAPHINAYIDLIAGAVQEMGVYLHCFQDTYWFDAPLLAKANTHFDEALAHDLPEGVRRRVEIARLPVQFAALTAPPTPRAPEGKFVLEYPPAPKLTDFLADLRRLGFDPEKNPAYDLPAHVRREAKHQGKRQRETYDRVILENERYLVWVVPGLSGAAVRWRDKAAGAELLRGFKHYGAGPGTWALRRHGAGVDTEAAAKSWEVVEQNSAAVTLAATGRNGLALRRTFTLAGDALTVSVSVNNPNGVRLVPAIEEGPVFFAPGPERPQLWLQRQEAWEQRPLDAHPLGLPVNAVDIAEAPGKSWAVYLPVQDLTITAAPAAGAAVESRSYYWNGEHKAQQANLAFIMDTQPLAPGKTRTLTATYRTHAGQPGG